MIMKPFQHSDFPTITIQLLHVDNEQHVQDFHSLLVNTTDYFTDYEIAPPSVEDTTSFFLDLPPNITGDKKFLYGVYDETTLIGFIDWVEDYPTINEGIIGYLVLETSYRGIGLASQLYKALEQSVKETGITAITVTTLKNNTSGNHFWKKEGFLITSETSSQYGEQHILKKNI